MAWVCRAQATTRGAVGHLSWILERPALGSAGTCRICRQAGMARLIGSAGAGGVREARFTRMGAGSLPSALCLRVRATARDSALSRCLRFIFASQARHGAQATPTLPLRIHPLPPVSHRNGVDGLQSGRSKRLGPGSRPGMTSRLRSTRARARAGRLMPIRPRQDQYRTNLDHLGKENATATVVRCTVATTGLTRRARRAHRADRARRPAGWAPA